MDEFNRRQYSRYVSVRLNDYIFRWPWETLSLIAAGYYIDTELCEVEPAKKSNLYRRLKYACGWSTVRSCT
ncbi:hypothetical protein PUN28_010374 [Cardiocondyla obscurior]|uniref:Uncharacterized protein n=1 Tax=Cardiocondyla obscurior TaxID=286306 RepID=A0AAW2FTM0_9HYME